MATYSYIGKGKIYLKVYGSSAGYVSVGNASQLQANIAEDKKELLDFTNAGGGLYDSVTRISSVSTSITVHDLNSSNLAIALRGSATENTSVTAITDESITGYVGLIPTARPINVAQSVVVTSDPAGTTYTEGTDYDISSAGITILAGGAISNGTALLVDYTPVAEDIVETLTTAAQSYSLVFEGLNEAQSGKPFIVKMHKVKFSPTSALDLIGDDFAGLEMTADVLADTSITTAGLSQYMKIQAQQIA